jgi:hypothetical protein
LGIGIILCQFRAPEIVQSTGNGLVDEERFAMSDLSHLRVRPYVPKQSMKEAVADDLASYNLAPAS